MGRLEGKVAIITGATSGIGAGCAVRFAQEGAKVAVVGRNEERGLAVVEQIKAAGSDGIFIQADLRDLSCIDRIVDETVAKFGKLDILFNNAGIIVNFPLEECTEELYDEVMTVDLKAPFFLTKKAMPYLIETKGAVLYTSSQAGHKPAGNSYLYNISKAGVKMLGNVVGTHYAALGVSSNVICPGLIDTPILAPIPKELVEIAAQGIPAKRIGNVDEVAALAVLLASDEAKFINGTDIIIDGGFDVRF